MNKTITFLEVLYNWQDYQWQQMESGRPYPEMMNNILLNPQPVRNWTTAWRKAASTQEIAWPQILHSKNGIYKIEIRQSETIKDNGFIHLEVNKSYNTEYEGKYVAIIDGKGRQLLKGKIKKGEVFEKVNKLDEIDLKLMIRVVE